MEALKRMAEMIAAGVEVGAALLMAYGALEAMVGAVRAIVCAHSNCAELDRHWSARCNRRHSDIPELLHRERS